MTGMVARWRHGAAVVAALGLALPAAAQLPATYQAYRTAAPEYISSQRLLRSDAELRREPYYDLLQCLEPPSTAAPLSRVAAEESLLAIVQSVMRVNLKRLGYPAALVDREVNAWERAQLAAIAANTSDNVKAASTHALARRLNAYRLANTPQLAEIIDDGGCGGGEMPITFDMQPNGRAFIIPRFYFLACRAGRVDPYDRDRCQGWGEVFDGREMFLWGDYIYTAMWSGGLARRGTLRIEGNGDEEQPPIVLRPGG